MFIFYRFFFHTLVLLHLLSAPVVASHVETNSVGRCRAEASSTVVGVGGKLLSSRYNFVRLFGVNLLKAPATATSLAEAMAGCKRAGSPSGGARK